MTQQYTVLSTGLLGIACAMEAKHKFKPLTNWHQKPADKGAIYPSQYLALYCEQCGETIQVLTATEMLVDD